jgi:general secretion pathway protein H
LFAGVITGLGSLTGSKARAAAGELSGVIRSLYDTASLTGHTCRLVFQLPEKDDDGPVKYWAECAAGNITTARDRDQALEDANRAAELAARDKGRPKATASRSSDAPQTPEEQEALEKARVAKLSRFSGFTSEEITPKALAGVQISVWTPHQQDPVKSGLAYLYFWPQGYTERAYVWFQQGDNTWTITVSPLTGKTSVVGKALEVPRS